MYDVAPQILGSFDKNLAEYAVSKFDRAGINIKGSRHVTKVGEGYLDIKEEGKVPFGLLVWNTGLAPNPLIESITELQKDEKTHSLRINDHFRTIANDGKEMRDVYCIGDASVLPDKLPATAQGTPDCSPPSDECDELPRLTPSLSEQSPLKKRNGSSRSSTPRQKVEQIRDRLSSTTKA